MNFIPGTLYKIKDKRESRTFMWMNVVGFQSNKLIYYLDDNNCLMFLGSKHPVNVFNSPLNNYYNFLGGKQIYSFIISPGNLATFCSHLELL